MKIRSCVILLMILTLYACKEADDRNTSIFKSYLQKEFKAEIPDSLHYYILIPKMLCKGCSVNTLSELEQLITSENEHRFTFISTNERFSQEFKKVKFYEYDVHGKLDELDLDIANVTIVKTQAGKVIFIKPIYIDEKRSLSEIITF